MYYSTKAEAQASVTFLAEKASKAVVMEHLAAHKEQLTQLIAEQMKLDAKVDEGFSKVLKEMGAGFAAAREQLRTASGEIKTQMQQGNEAVLRSSMEAVKVSSDTKLALEEQMRAAAGATAAELAGIRRDAAEQVQLTLSSLGELGASVEKQGAGAISAVRGLEEQLAKMETEMAAAGGGRGEEDEGVKQFLQQLQEQQLQLHEQLKEHIGAELGAQYTRLIREKSAEILELEKRVESAEVKSGQGVLGADASAIMQHLATQKEDLAAHKEQLA